MSLLLSIFSSAFALIFLIINQLCISHDLKRIADAIEDLVYGDEEDAEENEVKK